MLADGAHFRLCLTTVRCWPDCEFVREPRSWPLRWRTCPRRPAELSRIALRSRGASCVTSTRWETIMGIPSNAAHREPWNKGKIVGQKAPFKLKDIWALRVRLQIGTGAPQPWHRQQAAWMRSRRPQGPGRVPRRSGGDTRHRHAAQDSAPSAVRSRRQLETLSKRGSGVRGLNRRTFYSRAGCMIHRIWGRDSTLVSSGTGSTIWARTALSTGHTLCAAPRRR
jgi:hypothetical protein